MTTWTYRADAESPSYCVEWRDANGDLINFATGYTFEVKLVNQATAVSALTKSSGITGAATSPNITVAWTTGELNLTPATYQVHLTATASGADRHFRPGSEPLLKIVAAV
jgi:hypothetical protein